MWFYSDKSAPTLEAQPWHLRGVTMALRMRKHGTYLQYWKNIEKAKNKHRENKELFHFFLCFNLFLYLCSHKTNLLSFVIMPKSSFYIFVMLLAFLQLGCSTGNSYRYKIGVSQCVGGPWRDKVNNEMLSAQHLYDTDVEVTIVDANNNNARQCEQIDSMVNSGVDRKRIRDAMLWQNDEGSLANQRCGKRRYDAFLVVRK